MSDAFEAQARALAHSIPVCDLGSTAGIRAIAIGLRETWRMATEAAEEKSGKVIAGLNAQLTAEIDATGRFAARNITLESKLDWVRELGMSYSRDAHEAQKQIALLEQTIQNGAEMIRAAHARAEAAEMQPFRFFNGTWENSDLPTIVREDPQGGDPHILAVIGRVHNPDAIYELCRLANDALEDDLSTLSSTTETQT